MQQCSPPPLLTVRHKYFHECNRTKYEMLHQTQNEENNCCKYWRIAKISKDVQSWNVQLFSTKKRIVYLLAHFASEVEEIDLLF